MPPFVQLAMAQLKPRKGDYCGNLRRLRTVFAQLDAMSPRPQVLALPEAALTGYFLEGGVREVAVTAGTLAQDLDTAYRETIASPRPLDVVIGFYELWHDKLYNSALYVTLGLGQPQIRHVHRKMFLPTYGLFDEERFVERGLEIRAFDTLWGRAAMLVCEDAWHSMTATIAALDGAQILFVPTAPPARGLWPASPTSARGASWSSDSDGAASVPASVRRWERLARDIAEEHGVFVALTNLAGSEGGKVFPGASTVAGPKGEISARAPLWDEAILSLSIDLRDVGRARADMPLISDLETMIPHLDAALRRIREKGESRPVAFDPARKEAAPAVDGVGEASGTPRPAGIRVVTVGVGDRLPPSPLEIDGTLARDWLVHFIREEMARRGFSTAVVGVSGGVDSAVTAFLAAAALGAENVVGVRLPYRTSHPDSLAHAQLVIDALGIRAHTMDITEPVDGYLRQEPDADHSRRGNVMARVRMIALFDLSAKYHGVPLGTGNKTERLFGYFTWHADDSPPINPLGDLFKTQVWSLARFLGVPQAIIEKPPTADLVVGQTDEGDFGISYAKADAILNWMLHGFLPSELPAYGFSREDVAVVSQRLESTHWKRRLPTVALVASTAIGESYLRPVDY